MTRIDHKLLLSKVQDAERKYKSVAKAPPSVLADIQALTAVKDNRALLTQYEFNIMKWQFAGGLSMTEAATKMGHSIAGLIRCYGLMSSMAKWLMRKMELCG